MKNPHRDLPRVIFLGIPLVIVTYILSNIAYLGVLRPQVVMHTNTVAMDFGKKAFGPTGGILFAVCVALSCFGVIKNENKNKNKVINININTKKKKKKTKMQLMFIKTFSFFFF